LLKFSPNNSQIYFLNQSYEVGVGIEHSKVDLAFIAKVFSKQQQTDERLLGTIEK
jgi:hypothetical protein